MLCSSNEQAKLPLKIIEIKSEIPILMEKAGIRGLSIAYVESAKNYMAQGIRRC